MPMTSNRLDNSELEKVLDELFKKMEKMGIKIAEEAKDKIKKEMVSELSGSLTKSELAEPAVQKKLMACITSLLLEKGNKPSNNFKYEYQGLLKSLKDDDLKKQNDPKLEFKLNNELKLLLILSLVLEKNNTETNKLNPTPLSTQLLKNNKPQETKEEDRELQKQLDATLRNLFGGDNPTINGDIQFPIVGPIVGDLFGTVNQSVPDPNRVDFKTKEVTYNAGQPDYLGLENISKTNDVRCGDLVLSSDEVAKSYSPQNTRSS